jgi:hypothetical protein
MQSNEFAAGRASTPRKSTMAAMNEGMIRKQKVHKYNIHWID